MKKLSIVLILAIAVSALLLINHMSTKNTSSETSVLQTKRDNSTSYDGVIKKEGAIDEELVTIKLESNSKPLSTPAYIIQRNKTSVYIIQKRKLKITDAIESHSKNIEMINFALDNFNRPIPDNTEVNVSVLENFYVIEFENQLPKNAFASSYIIIVVIDSIKMEVIEKVVGVV